MNDNQDNSNNLEKKPSTVIHILIGFGISIVAYALAIGTSFLINSMVFTSITELILLALFAFLVVKFFRKGYKTIAITMLILITPLMFFLLFLGACTIILLPPS